MCKNISSKNNQAFTLVELIVVVTIVAVLGTIGWISFFGIQLLARDTTRVSDITNIAKTVELSQLKQGKFPVVTNGINVTFSGAVIWQQGSFGEDSWRESQILSQIPIDPLTGSEYAYSTTQFTGEYQVGGIIEGGFSSNLPSIVGQTHAADILPTFSASTTKGNYNGKFIAYTDQVSEGNNDIYILGVPSILVNEIVDVSLEEIFLNDSFILEGQRTIPATFSGSLDAARTGWDFAPDIQEDAEDNILPEYVIYKTTTQDLSTSDDKVSLVANLKDYYDDTEVAATPKFQDLESIDPVSDPVSALSLVNSFVSGIGVGGLSEDTTEVAQSDASQLTQVDTVGTACVDVLTQGEVDELNIATYANYSVSEWCEQTFVDIYTSSLPSGFYKLLQVEGLRIENNSMTNIPSGLESMPNLTAFMFISDNMTALSAEIGNLTNLEVLYLQSVYNLTSLPPEIGNLTNLTSLRLEDTNLSSLPPEIENLTNLTIADIDIGTFTGHDIRYGGKIECDTIGTNGENICIDSTVNPIQITSNIPVTSCVDTVTPTAENYFTFDSVTQTITDYDTAGGTDLVIPCAIGGVDVVNIDYLGNKGFTSIVIGDNVTSIPDYGFYPSNGLTSLTLGSSITSIGVRAFDESQIAEIIIPDSVTSIGESAFAYNNLTSVTLGDGITSIGEGAFDSNQLTSIIIPDSVTSIGIRAFESNALTSVVIGNSVTSIGIRAFQYNALTSVVIGNSVTSIGESAFRHNSLTSIVIGNSVTSIGDYAFFQGNNLTSLTLGSNVENIGQFAFADNALTSVVIPDSVITIGDGAFASGELSSVVIPDSVTSIGDGAFNSNQLTSIIIPDSVIDIGEYAFEYNALTSIIIPDSVITIGDGAFAYNNVLASVTIGNNVTSIGRDAFAQNALTSVVIGNSVENIGNQAFGFQNQSTGSGTVFGPAGYVQDRYNDPNHSCIGGCENANNWFDKNKLTNYVIQ